MPTYAYVANAEDGEIVTYRLNAGELVPGGRAKVAAQVMPLAVSPDRRRLYAAVRSKPFSVHVFSIDPQLWVREESLYIRYEDVVVITETGYENFTAFLPSELNDLEKQVKP